MSNLREWIVFQRLRSLSSPQKKQLVLTGKPIRHILEHLENKGLFAKEDFLSLEEALKWADTEQERAAMAHVGFLVWDDERFPPLLKEIPDPPFTLYVQGNTQLLHARLPIAMVGSRKATAYGLSVADKFARRLCELGCTIISGLALGIDAKAHQAVLDAEPKDANTIAVLGCGIDHVYPSNHRSLQTQIGTRGLVVSEFSMGETPRKHYFPMRNRLISGLSLAVFVVEASEKSGALITARRALDQGRSIFTIPHNITNSQGVGCNQLIRAGATICLDPCDLVDDILPQAGGVTARKDRPQNAVYEVTPMSAREEQLLQLIEARDSVTLEQLAEVSGMNFEALIENLAHLQVKRRIKRNAHGKFSIIAY